jgi:hypothetical protein
MTPLAHCSTARYAFVGLAAFVLLPTVAGAAEDENAITPYRPSVSSPAQLPVAGQLEFELGGLQARSGPARRGSLPYQFKLAFSPEWGVLVGGEARVWVHDGDVRSQGLGDTTIVLKRAWIVDDASAFGMEFGAKLPTARDDIGSGKADYGVNTIYSRDIGAVHMDANFNTTRLGLAEAGSSRTQLGASASFSTEFSAQWGVTGEVSGTRRAGAISGVQLLTALTFSPSKRLTFDIGVARAVLPTPASTLLFAGVVFPITKLW